MDRRQLGRTGHDSSVVIFGTAAFWEIEPAAAHAALDLAVARGVNHIDVAPQYGKAQDVLGPWLAPRRDRFFLGCKTLEREREAAWADLQNSLRVLQTGYVDLYQFHAICTLEQLDQVFAPGGAFEAFQRARDEGLTRYLGITSHGMDAPRVQLAALERYDFDTVMFPLNPRLYADAGYRQAAETLLAVCRERAVGVQIIKSIAREPWNERDKTYNSWYEPDASPDEIAKGVQFALSQPGVTAIVSAADVRLLPLIYDAADRFAPMDAAAQDALIAERAGRALIFDGPWPRSK